MHIFEGSLVVGQAFNLDADLAAAGIYLADRRIFDFFPASTSYAGRVLDLGFHVFPKLAGQMKVYEIDELIDIGTPQAYETANRVWQTKAR